MSEEAEQVRSRPPVRRKETETGEIISYTLVAGEAVGASLVCPKEVLPIIHAYTADAAVNIGQAFESLATEALLELTQHPDLYAGLPGPVTSGSSAVEYLLPRVQLNRSLQHKTGHPVMHITEASAPACLYFLLFLEAFARWKSLDHASLRATILHLVTTYKELSLYAHHQEANTDE